MAAAFEGQLDAAAVKTPSPGGRSFQRLNRAEYARAVKEMLNLDIEVSALLPADTIVHGFDNVVDAQTFSPALMESYLRAASRVTALALGDREAAASESLYRVPKTASQLQRVDGAPFGTRGGEIRNLRLEATDKGCSRIDNLSAKLKNCGRFALQFCR
jgi:hypothetical protein